MATMTPLRGFLKLPRELRDQIYADYFAIEGGYQYNYATNKLTTSGGTSIDHNIRLTCRQVAVETRGLALKLNTINFSTVCDENLYQRAGQFNALLEMISELKADYLLRDAPASGLIDGTIRDYAERHYPRFFPFVQGLQKFQFYSSDSDMWKEIPSQSRNFIAAMLKVVDEKPDFTDNVSQDACWKGAPYEPGPDPVPIIALNHPPWTLPSEKDIADMLKLMAPHSVKASRFRATRYWDKEKYRFSAATLAICFLESMPAGTRLEMCRLVLHEDHKSVAWPECHSQGLIPFCQENSDLHIERRVDLWRTILPAASIPLYALMARTPEILQRYKYDRVTAQMISRGHMGYGGVAGWIMEALALESLGMPVSSISLIIDGKLTPEISTQVFDILQRDAAWQSAYEQCVGAPNSQSPPSSLVQIRKNDAYIMSGFPEALQEIVCGKSLVKCNFDTGLVRNVDQVVVKGRAWTDREWCNNWRATRQLQTDIHTITPLPSWLDIRREDLVEETGMD